MLSSIKFTSSRTNRSYFSEWWRTIDRLGLTLLLLSIASGLILSLAASPAASARLGLDDPFYFFFRQLVFVTLGLSGAFFISSLSHNNARRIGVLVLLGALLLLISLPFIGYEVKGANRWIRLGSLSLQPSEFIKPAFIVFAAWIFSSVKSNNSIQAGLIVTLIWLLIISLLLGQPDVGQAFLLTVCFAAVCFFGGISIRGTMTFVLVIMGLVSLAYLKLNYFRVRIEKFLSPSTSDTYQIDKAIEAISNGGFLGRGPGEGAVKYSLPDGHTDYIFAVTVEEFGYLISTFLIILLGSFVLRGFRNAVRLNDYFSQLAVAGLATMIGVQLLINLFVNLNMMPSKGMTLPFISYGGSSMLALCFAAGLILSFTRKRPGAYGYGE